MPHGRTNPEVDAFLAGAQKWRDEFTRLRSIVLECGLTEEVKWRQPCYTADGRNIVLIGGFKAYCVLLFMKGALLTDPEHLLVTPGQLQSGRQIRFTGVDQIAALEPVLKAYIREAVEVEKAGLKVEKRQTTDFAVPEEFQSRLDGSPALKAAFAALTPGRQRAYLFHFSGAKQSKTRASRVEGCLEKILAGKGLDD